ncbi:DUF2141 domain-containing protein [Cytophagaceae bacterium YF14B1]|uniref:DUF2141 domain-containing protein n=1 Tax=Xanthocytophaga flava TaxID=3048013 RepID=A0AAE3QKC0_9BACT|nr:DUF2141 domain-containing protein [Xanthocytophaga flavus]MDJ1479060.1 DUF2141 domain-containing protein [Xanthocytophaga flavus]
MRKKIVFCMSVIGLIFVTFSFSLRAQNRQIKVSGIRSEKGKIIVSIFKNAESYESEKPFKRLVFDKKDLTNGSMMVSVPLESGVYGMAMVDDENNNGEIDKNFVGIPQEGFGFSNFFLTKMKKPAFDEFKVNLSSTNTRVEMKVKYL